MADRNELIQRYSDLLDSELDDDELQAVALLDAAAAPYRQIEPPVSLDRAVERFVRQRRAPALNGASIEPVPSETARYSSSPSRLPTRMRTGWLRQGLGMVAAVLAVALLAGVLAVTFRNQGQSQQGGLGGGATATDAVAVPTPDASGQYHNLSFAQAQQIAPFHLVQPAWVPSYLHDESITASVTNSTEAQSSTPAASTAPPTGTVQVVSVNFMGPWPKSPAVTINELQQDTPLGPSGGPNSGLGVTSTTITIAGHPVMRSNWSITSAGPPSGSNTKYVWTDQGTTFQLMALITEPVNEQDVEHMIASMVQQSGTSSTASTTVPAPATVVTGPPPLTFTEAQQLVSFYVSEPSWVPQYLVNNGVVIGGFSPRLTPTPQDVHNCSLQYRPTDSNQSYSLTIREFDSTKSPVVYGGTSSTITIDGQTITRTVATRRNATDPHLLEFTWSYQGTFFWVDAEMGGPLTEQDIEHMIASMLTPDSGASATATSVTPTSSRSR